MADIPLDTCHGLTRVTVPGRRLTVAIGCVTGGIASARYAPLMNLMFRLRNGRGRETAQKMRVQFGPDALIVLVKDAGQVLLVTEDMDLAQDTITRAALKDWRDLMTKLLTGTEE